ncbi:hypothetical protein SMMN14_05010 [Sphaerulina musiva]
MSSSMPIPKRKQPLPTLSGSSSSSSSSYGSFSSMSPPRTPSSSTTPWKGKSKVPIASSSFSASSSSASSSAAPTATAALTSSSPPISPRRPSLMGSSLSKSEYTVINLSHHEDGPPRLVTCVKSSQGFDWNQELFLPSYANEYGESSDLEHRPDPVEEIVLTDEEAAAILPV